ncbi:MAG: glycosyltransferase family 2 protein [Candidatus Rokubacteria bacterium]|nr:glycosyltransferase family 2 protein [Candidatus Rokubacteria bacterium]
MSIEYNLRLWPGGDRKAPEAQGVSVVMPVYNEHDNLEPLHARVTAVLKRMECEYEVIYVDDGSTDGSWEVLRLLAVADPRVRLVRLRKNFGQTPATAAGIAHSRHPVLITLDADGQNDPEDIPRLVSVLGSDYDVVSGWRRDRKDSWLTRRLPSMIANAMIRWITGVKLHDFGCTLKAYRREIVDDVRLYGEKHRFLPVLAAWVGGRITELEVMHHSRMRGVSKYSILRAYKVLIELFTLKFMGDFATRPNYVFGGFGLVSFLLGLAALGRVAYRYVFHGQREVTSMTVLMAVLFLSGILSILMGFLAELIIRASHDSQRKRSYYVRETVNVDKNR